MKAVFSQIVAAIKRDKLGAFILIALAMAIFSSNHLSWGFIALIALIVKEGKTKAALEACGKGFTAVGGFIWEIVSLKYGFLTSLIAVAVILFVAGFLSNNSMIGGLSIALVVFWMVGGVSKLADRSKPFK